MDLTSKVSNYFEIVYKIALILAISFGAKLYFFERSHVPHLNVSLEAKHVPLKYKTGEKYTKVNVLQVLVEITNIGKVKAELPKQVIKINKISEEPSDLVLKEIENCLEKQNSSCKEKDEFSWFEITKWESEKERTIEPGEIAQMDYEFAIPGDVEMVQIYFFSKEDAKKLGWTKSIWYKFDEKEDLKSKAIISNNLIPDVSDRGIESMGIVLAQKANSEKPIENDSKDYQQEPLKAPDTSELVEMPEMKETEKEDNPRKPPKERPPKEKVSE